MTAIKLKKIIDDLYGEHTPKILKLKKSNISDKELNEISQRKIQSSLKDLSAILVVFYRLWLTDQEKGDQMVYGDLLLAFIGDKIIRHWPNKEIVFKSKKHTENLKNSIVEKTVDEHKAPISFFRDIFVKLKDNKIGADDEDLTDAFYYCLATYYRVVTVTKSEDDELTMNGLRNRACHDRYQKIEFDGEKKIKEYNEMLIGSISQRFR